MNSKFDDLVRSLDPQTLEELRRSVAAELGGRREETAIQIEHIHPKMSVEAREEAAREIARVLRGETLKCRTLKKYWQEIRAIEKTLAADVWLMSLENRAQGQVAGSIAGGGGGRWRRSCCTRNRTGWRRKRKWKRIKRGKRTGNARVFKKNCGMRGSRSYL